ncbi:MAG TPA: phosphatidylserine decarboxylase [Planctomycetota bacterium]|nr:phosphatidylserine decarboxylase [Planctomycetota bacterium]
MILISVGARALGSPVLGVAAVVPAALLAFTIQFFRDPERQAPGGPETIVSPADGTVVDIVELTESEFIGGPAVRVGIFMSPFNCHVNRFPVDGTVAKVVHRAGKFLKAYDPRAIEENEASITGIRATVEGREVPIMLRQVSGVAARRIVNPLAPGDRARRGERFGMIKFGSRCEVFVPRDAGVEIAVKLGDKVYSGRSVLGRVAAVAAGVRS